MNFRHTRQYVLTYYARGVNLVRQFNNRVVDYFREHQNDVIRTLLPKNLEELNIKFTEQDLHIHYEMLHLLLDRVTSSLKISKEEISKNELGYDSLNYFFNQGVQLKETVAVLGSFRLSLLKYLRNSKIIDGNDLEEGLQIYETIIFAFDEAIRITTQQFNNQTEQNKQTMENELDNVAAPIVFINDDDAVMPLVGGFSSSRMDSVVNNTLNQVVKLDVRKLIIDFSGFVGVSTVIFQKLFELIGGLKLVGTKVEISGFSPKMAKTFTELGLDLTHVPVYGQLRHALASSP
ncbi:rsbT co-antagonist protein RsbR [Bacillus sp. OV322]|nr:rsbT co-antagonist protein RsbR [Bacillus sp. OV322]